MRFREYWDELWDGLIESMDDWLKRGAMTILLKLCSRSMRYSELKKATGLPSGTLDRRLSELIKIRLVRQKTHMTPSGRYRLIYEVVDGAREMLIGIQMYIAEAELEKRYRKIIDATDLTDEGKECAKREFHKRFSLISDAIATVFFQSYAIGKKSEKR